MVTSRDMVSRLGAVAVGMAADRTFGEPPVRPHPVAAFGTVMTRLEKVVWRDRRSVGAGYAATGVGGAAALGLGSAAALGAASSVGAWVASAASTWVTVAGRGLGDAARDVAAPLVAGDLEAARARLPALVGRDPRDLDEVEIVRAVVESVAENTVDALVAPALWTVLGGAAGALGYRAVNTLDSMVGHHSARYERFGWASARLDDVANWVPARVTALAVMACRPARARVIWGTVRRDAGAHPSPNAGVAEAAFAAALGVRLGGTNHYGSRVEHRAALGDGRPPAAADIEAAVALADDVSRLIVAVLVVAWVVQRWR
jgi:adenosylcobinamide-phosphate synthase